MPATLDFGVALDNTMGAMLLGTIVSGVLHGICLLQAFYYFNNYKHDHWILKSMVITTCVFDATHLSFLTHAMYHYLVTGFRNEEALHRLVWSVLLEALLTGVNGGIVQTFYVYRIWTLSKKNYYLCGLIMLLILSTAGSGIAWVVLSMQFDTYAQLITINPVTITINALSTTSDVLIASSLCWMLHTSRTGFKRSDTIINKLMIFVVNTGLLTTICAIISLAFLVGSPHSLLYAATYFCIGRFYTNSFLATLNARRAISKSNPNTHQDSSSNMMMSIPRSMAGGIANPKAGQQGLAIRVDTTKHAVDDMNEMRKTPLGIRANIDEASDDGTSNKSTEKFSEKIV
ncbi:hypothetical protein D9611_013580 [Ephemerocybe angulata]|uniref:DUF6534 domain-containing protein n=1 Tax=Ephemerocybe angulata TaxID=980116 RepID=A0A8H5ERU6_9AGAR|nr:hypothetical protein D9611_013580 [Tulosesus angulatus]